MPKKRRRKFSLAFSIYPETEDKLRDIGGGNRSMGLQRVVDFWEENNPCPYSDKTPGKKEESGSDFLE